MDHDLKLIIELVPRTSWGTNLHKLMPKKAWDEVRQATYKEHGYRCGVCGAQGRMTCHERWAYDDAAGIQTLLGFIALCDLCNHVKHIGLAGILARQGYLDYDAVVAHFLRVNGCDRETFEQHREQAYAVWRQRSARPWTVDFGPYAALIDRQQAAAPATDRGGQRAARAPGHERGRSGRAARPPGA